MTGVQKQIAPKIKILVVDDDTDFLESTKLFYETYDFITVKTCTSPEEAVLIMKEDFYHIVIADINFKRKSKISGVTFVIDNRKSLLSKSYVLIVTGLEDNKIQNVKELKKLSVPIVGKDSNWHEVVSEFLKKTSKDFFDLLKKTFSDKEDIVISDSDSLVQSNVKGLLLDWLDSLPNKEEKVFLMGRKASNVIDLVQEVEEETPIGNRLLNMFVRDLRHSLRLENVNENYEKQS